MVDRTDDPKPTFRRLEVIDGAGRRRRWPTAMKAAIVAESLEPGAVVAQVARRHDVRAQQIHDWRRDARAGRLVLPSAAPDAAMTFAPVVVAAVTASPEPAPCAPRLAHATADPEAGARGLTRSGHGWCVRGPAKQGSVPSCPTPPRSPTTSRS